MPNVNNLRETPDIRTGYAVVSKCASITSTTRVNVTAHPNLLNTLDVDDLAIIFRARPSLGNLYPGLRVQHNHLLLHEPFLQVLHVLWEDIGQLVVKFPPYPLR